MKGVDINDPIMKEFVENLDAVNQIAESSEGFVWRLKDDTNNATSLNPYDDEQVIINVSVWQSIETLENFMYKTFHSEFLKRRKEWFVAYGTAMEHQQTRLISEISLRHLLINPLCYEKRGSFHSFLG
ncbi:MAG: hypothetical protein RLZZ209_1537 [Bacteroidota bacterium]